MRRRPYLGTVLAFVCALACAIRASATGVPIGGFLPQVGIALTNEYKDDLDTNAAYSNAPGGLMLGQGGTAHYDVALMDTGAAVTLLTPQSHIAFNLNGAYSGNPDGYQGTYPLPLGGANGSFVATNDDPLGLYAGGLQNVTGTNPLTISNSALKGQTNTSLATMPAGVDLPNVLGLPFVSQYATYIRNDQPQIQQINGRTVRSPAIEFNPIGGSNQGIARRAFVTLDPGSSFSQPPAWVYDFANPDFLDKPYENPIFPSLVQGGMFLTADMAQSNKSVINKQFLFDTGADITVLSEQTAYSQLGLDQNHPDFTVAITGAGGTSDGVPGYFLDSFTIQASSGGGNLTLTHVPIVVFDLDSPVDGNTLPGIIGMNLLAGRNVVINPKNGAVQAGVYISDPVTTSKDWTTAAASGTWSTGGNWTGSTAPNNLGIANVRHVSGGNQVAELAASTTVWEVNVSGAAANQLMTLNVQNGVRLTTFSGINVESNGILQLSGGTLDAQFVEVSGGTLRGSGLITTGSGSIAGQVENRGGTVSPGNGIGTLSIEGRFANAANSTLAIELGGLAAGTGYDQLIVDGPAALAGTLQVSLVNFKAFAGDVFTILTANSVGGQFDSVVLPGGVTGSVSYGATSVVLSITGLIGDFNGDNKVDGADYVVWRKTDGSPQRYLNWRSHYGAVPGSGSSIAASVPEPTSVLLTAISACVFSLRRGRRS